MTKAFTVSDLHDFIHDLIENVEIDRQPHTIDARAVLKTLEYRIGLVKSGMRAKMKDLAKSGIFPPPEITREEMDLYRTFCRGSISALRWQLGEADGHPPHELKIMEEP